MSTPPQTSSPRLVSWTVAVSYVIAIAMAACIAITATLTMRRLIPSWDARGLPVACTLAAIESAFSYWLLKHSITAQRQTLYYRLTEWIIILVALKIFTELRGGTQALLDNILHWSTSFPTNLFTGNYLLNVILVYATWQISTVFAADLYLLEVDEAVRVDERLAKSPIRSLILRRFLYLGMLVIILVGLLLEDAWLPGQTIYDGSIYAALLYFVFGLTLVSITRYASLEASWRQAQVRVPARIPVQWVVYSLLILGLLTALAIWLPNNYGLGFLATMKSLMRLIGAGISLAYGLLLYAIYKIAQVFARATGKQQPEVPEEPPKMPMIPQNPPGVAFLEIITSLLFWGGLLALAFVVLRQYLVFNQDFVNELRNFRPLRWLAAFWKRFKISFNKANKKVGALIKDGIQRLRSLRVRSAETGEWDYVNLRRLNTRQKIIFYYLALVKRAGEAGIPRQGEQTPYEYMRALTSHMGEEKGEIETITESFVEARYSAHEISKEKVSRAESLWELLRHALRQGKKSRKEEKPPSIE